MDLLSPTKGAFLQHIKRANYQGRIWKQASVPMQIIYDPINHGWHKDEQGLFHAI